MKIKCPSKFLGDEIEPGEIKEANSNEMRVYGLSMSHITNRGEPPPPQRGMFGRH